MVLPSLPSHSQSGATYLEPQNRIRWRGYVDAWEMGASGPVVWCEVLELDRSGFES